MTISANGVRFSRRTRNRWLLPLAIGFEAVLSFFLYVSFAAHTLWPEDTKAAVGVASVLSYEGRLMDASGNPLGSTGTPYCFRFSIYDAASGGTKLWPAGTPATTMATSTDGVFSALIGQADSLTYNFYDSDTVFLNVDVNTTPTTCGGSWESLSPRQRIGSTGYAQSAKNVYSDTLFTDVTNNRVQIGSGVGGASPKFLGLDVKNTNDYIGQSCTTSGTVWYNSAISKALVCENGVIQAISNSSATTTLAALTANVGTPATTGTIVFSNSNGVTFGINGNTITASVAAGGGGGNTYSSTNFGNARGWAVASVSLGQNTVYLYPEVLQDAVAGSVIKMPVMVTNSSSAFAAHTRGYTANFGVYSRNATNSTVLTLHYSTSYTASFSASSNASWHAAIITGIQNSTSYNTLTASSAGLNLSASIHGAREFIFPMQTTLTAGEYWFAFRNSSSSAGAAGNLFNLSHIIASSQTQNRLGNSLNSTNIGIARNMGIGVYSVTSASLPNGISMTQINGAGTTPIFYYLPVTS